MGETLENHAARVLASLRQGIPADDALRQYLASSRTLGAVGKRSVSRAVFTYFRWINWLGSGESAQKRVLKAGEKATDHASDLHRNHKSGRPGSNRHDQLGRSVASLSE